VVMVDDARVVTRGVPHELREAALAIRVDDVPRFEFRFENFAREPEQLGSRTGFSSRARELAEIDSISEETGARGFVERIAGGQKAHVVIALRGFFREHANVALDAAIRGHLRDVEKKVHASN